MDLIYEKIPEKEKENLKIRLDKANNKIKEINKVYTDSLFAEEGFVEYEPSDMWIIDRKTQTIFIKYGFYDYDSSIETPYNYYCVYALFFKDETIMMSLYENLMPKGLFVDIDEIYVPNILKYNNIDFSHIIKHLFMEKYPNKNVFLRFLCNINFL